MWQDLHVLLQPEASRDLRVWQAAEIRMPLLQLPMQTHVERLLPPAPQAPGQARRQRRGLRERRVSGWTVLWLWQSTIRLVFLDLSLDVTGLLLVMVCPRMPSLVFCDFFGSVISG